MKAGNQKGRDRTKVEREEDKGKKVKRRRESNRVKEEERGVAWGGRKWREEEREKWREEKKKRYGVSEKEKGENGIETEGYG